MVDDRTKEIPFPNDNFVKVGEINEDKSYGVVLDYIKKYPFVILSAYRQNYNRQENRDRLKALIKEFFNLTNIGGIPMKWVGQEEDPETGDIIQATERSALFILRGDRKYKISTPDELLEVAKKLARKYEQDAFIFGDGSGTLYLYEREGNDYLPNDKYTYNRIKDGISMYYSRLKGNPFHFESAEFYAYKGRISGMIEGMAFGHYANTYRLQ